MRATILATAALLLMPSPGWTGVISPWAKGHSSRARLLAGTIETPGKFLAGVEVEMPPGWKTYWRQPGDGGGVPPTFDWSGSENLVRATVLYPAPARHSDKGGDTIGYKGRVLFPVVLEPLDGAKPMSLRLAFSYGVCREICIPVEAEIRLDVPAGGGGDAPEIATSLEQVPRAERERRPGDPVLVRSVLVGGDAKRHLAIEADFPGESSAAQAFVEGPNGVSFPLPEKAPSAGGEPVRFSVDLSDVDLGELKGSTLVMTLVGERGHSETTVPVE